MSPDRRKVSLFIVHPQSDAAKVLVEAGGVRVVAKKLLALERRLPYTCQLDFKTWEDWRRDVKYAQTAAQLARQVLNLSSFSSFGVAYSFPCLLSNGFAHPNFLMG